MLSIAHEFVAVWGRIQADMIDIAEVLSPMRSALYPLRGLRHLRADQMSLCIILPDNTACGTL